MVVQKSLFFLAKKLLKSFCSLNFCLTFVIAFGKQRRVARLEAQMILDNIPYRQAVQRVL